MPTGAGHPRHETVWSQESSGAAVRMQRPEVSCSGLCRVGMLSAPSGPLPSWELSPWVFSLSRSRPVCVESSIREQKWNFRLHHIRFFCVRDYSFSCFYVSCRRKPLMSILFWESGHSGASVWERKWNWGLHLIQFFIGPRVSYLSALALTS